MKIKKFEKELIKKQLSESTIISYKTSIKLYSLSFKKITDNNLKLWKALLLENNKPQTINLRLRALNLYCEIFDLPYKIKYIKINKRTYLDNVISNSDYLYLCRKLKKDNLGYYFIVRFLASTGSRISELLQFKIEHLQIGYVDIYTKGNKIRRIYINKKLQKEALTYYNINSGFLFNIKQTTIRNQFKEFAIKYKIPSNVMHPHSFRHLFAKNFIAKYQDIALLADLMGHSSIETTRIYLQRTSAEQKEIVDKIITW